MPWPSWGSSVMRDLAQSRSPGSKRGHSLWSLHAPNSLICGLLVLPLLLTACSPLVVRVNVIKIGLVAPFEGRYRYIGYDAIYAARLAVQEINLAGGVAGWRIDLVAYDDRGSPEMARNAARNLTVDPDVIAVIGHYRQESTAAAQPIYAAASMPLIIVGTWLPPTQNTTPSWHLMPSPRQVAQAMIDTADALPDQQTLAVLGAGSLASALYQKVELRPYNMGQTDNPPYADTALSTLPPHIGAETLITWHSRGWRGHYIGGWDCAAQEFTAIAGEAIEGVHFVTPYPLPQAFPKVELREAIETWITRYQALGPHVAPPGIYALPTYEAVHSLAETLAHMIETKRLPNNRTGVAAALPTTQRQGLLGPIAWDTDGFWSQAPLYIYQWTKGHPVPVKCSAPTQKSDF